MMHSRYETSERSDNKLDKIFQTFLYVFEYELDAKMRSDHELYVAARAPNEAILQVPNPTDGDTTHYQLLLQSESEPVEVYAPSSTHSSKICDIAIAHNQVRDRDGSTIRRNEAGYTFEHFFPSLVDVIHDDR